MLAGQSDGMKAQSEEEALEQALYRPANTVHPRQDQQEEATLHGVLPFNLISNTSKAFRSSMCGRVSRSLLPCWGKARVSGGLICTVYIAAEVEDHRSEASDAAKVNPKLLLLRLTLPSTLSAMPTDLGL
eukprot:9350577-Pyramimonas_sp.AAC.1